jgi:hypothetical protein
VDVWELVAREQIRDAIHAYAYAGDRLMVDEMAAVFLPDGVLEIARESARYSGRAEISARLSLGMGDSSEEARSRAKKQQRATGKVVIRRHLVTNIRFEELSQGSAVVSSYFTVVTHDGLDHFGRYRDAFVSSQGQWFIGHRLVTRDWQRAAEIGSS